MGDRRNEGIILKFTSDVYVSIGRLSDAEQLLVQSLEIADRLNNRKESADSIYRLGVTKDI